MNSSGANTPFVAIACGGTGGHLFPGWRLRNNCKQRGCTVALLISPKDVDQEAVKSARGMEIFTLPAVGLQNRNYFSFAGSFVKSLFAAKKIFRQRRPARRARYGRIHQRAADLGRERILARKLFCTNPTPFPVVPTVCSRGLWMRRLSVFRRRQRVFAPVQ